ncbi:21077_t:CDS:2 [Gigaspora margarita]|uniref:21077_t:CDS:1 n=1 Tax=Gigaspora margarita TaxID=4874 RepID=A0ABM8VZY2_GIGMA|nr:21077_t:CDS:2 [Gigaspora margarita]
MNYYHISTTTKSFYIFTLTLTAFSFKLELSNFELQELEYRLANHQAFSIFQPSSDLYYLETILKGLIPIPIIQSFQSFNISYKIASTTIIQILLDINEQIYNQI